MTDITLTDRQQLGLERLQFELEKVAFDVERLQYRAERLRIERDAQLRDVGADPEKSWRITDGALTQIE